MNKLIYKFFLISLALLCAGCASTQMTSFKDSSYESAVYKRLLVVVNVADLEKRFYFESKMSTVFNDTGVYAKEGYKLFPPTRTLNDSEKIDLLRQENIDGYISVDVGESGIAQIYIPPTHAHKNGARSEAIASSGYTISKPWAEYYAKLIDASSGKTAWISSAFTGGNAFATNNTVINSFCDKILSQLVADKLIKTRDQIKKELDHLNISGLLADTSDRQYLYYIDKRKMVHIYMSDGISDAYLVGETPSKYLILSDKEARDRIQYIPKRIVQKLEDIK
jgi:hypothetical protein